MRKVFFYLSFFLFLNQHCASQANNLRPENAVWEGPESDTIPVELAQGSIILTISVEGRRCRFIFDTGAPFSISETLHKRNRFDSLGTQIIRDATGHIDSIKNVLIPELKIGKLRITNTRADVLDYRKSSFFKCLNIDGLIGGDIFKTCLVEIDLKHKRLIIFPRQEFSVAGDDEIPVSFDEQYNPVFELRLNGAYRLNVLFDTGAEDLLTIPEERYIEGGRFCQFREVRNGKYTLAGAYNIAVSDNYKVMTIDSLTICHTGLKYPEISIATRNDISILGAAILDYGVVRLDYRSSRIRFIPYEADMVFTKAENFPGFSIGRENMIYVINGIESGSAAAIHGLDAGMQITKIGNINLNVYSPKKDCRILRKNLPGLEKITVEYIDHNRKRKTVTLERLTALQKK